MSEAPTPRTPQDIQRDYNVLCAQVGDIEFKVGLQHETIDQLFAKKEELIDKLKALQTEAQSLKEAT